MLALALVLAASLGAALATWAGVSWMRARQERGRARRAALVRPVATTTTTYALGAAAIAPASPRAATPTPRPVAQAAALASTEPRVCPSCRSEHTGFTFCPRDARRLISPEEMLVLMQSDRTIGATLTTGVCPRCRRAQAPGQRTCPHDGAAFVPRNALVHWPLRPRAPTEPAGVIGKICPQCQARYDLGMRFCGHDGADLVVIN